MNDRGQFKLPIARAVSPSLMRSTFEPTAMTAASTPPARKSAKWPSSPSTGKPITDPAGASRSTNPTIWNLSDCAVRASTTTLAWSPAPTITIFRADDMDLTSRIRPSIPAINKRSRRCAATANRADYINNVYSQSPPRSAGNSTADTIHAGRETLDAASAPARGIRSPGLLFAGAWA